MAYAGMNYAGYGASGYGGGYQVCFYDGCGVMVVQLARLFPVVYAYLISIYDQLPSLSELIF